MRFMRMIEGLGIALLCSCMLHGQTLNTLYSFGHNKSGYQPTSGVVVGPNGELYGTTLRGGAGSGVIYELVPPTSPNGAWTQVVLHNFNEQNGEGPPPYGAGVMLGPSGALYGTTTSNSSGGHGTVFQLKPPAGSSIHWREITLYAFTGVNGDGTDPAATPVFGPHFARYGTTSYGGLYTNGTVFRLLPPTGQPGIWAQQTLYSLQFSAGDGVSPIGALALDASGRIYAATTYGGTYSLGTVFRLAPTAQGGPWTEKVLHNFGSGSSDPALPTGVVLSPNGVLYGAASGAVLNRECSGPCGSVFQLTPPAAPGGPWTETILHLFTGGNHEEDGTQPNSTPVLGPNGVLYGTTYSGGIYDQGIIYEMVPPSSPGGDWTEVILYTFTGGADGTGPTAVTLGPDGNLYGTTQFGGISQFGVTNQGTVFQLVLPQSASVARR